jgi:hypothetical protein
MRIHLRNFVRFFDLESLGVPQGSLGWAGLFLTMTVLTLASLGPALGAQTPNRITKVVDTTHTLALTNHHPLWANDANDAGALPADESLNQFTMVLARSAEQEQAFEQLLADQQNPSSANYHHWLTPAEIGDQFGLSSADIGTITSWLESQGLHVNWVSPSRIFIGFGGAAMDVGRAFQTEMHAYKVKGEERTSVASDPMIPEALAPAIKSIRGLYTIPEKPSYRMEVRQADSPQVTTSNGSHYLAPSDFATIYDVPNTYTGASTVIGIVSWSRTNPADFTAFNNRTGSSINTPTEVIPTAYGGLDPGPAYTTTQTCTNDCIGGQTEATLDVLRASSVATRAQILLVVSSPSGSNDGIGADAEYIVQTNAAQVMSISFGGCESSAGAGGVAFWNALFQQGAAEGISTFVSSGDSGASGCDVAFSAPPGQPLGHQPELHLHIELRHLRGRNRVQRHEQPSHLLERDKLEHAWVGSGLHSGRRVERVYNHVSGRVRRRSEPDQYAHSIVADRNRRAFGTGRPLHAGCFVFGLRARRLFWMHGGSGWQLCGNNVVLHRFLRHLGRSTGDGRRGGDAGPESEWRTGQHEYRTLRAGCLSADGLSLYNGPKQRRLQLQREHRQHVQQQHSASERERNPAGLPDRNDRLQ